MNFRVPWNWNNPEIEMMSFCNLNWLTINWCLGRMEYLFHLEQETNLERTEVLKSGKLPSNEHWSKLKIRERLAFICLCNINTIKNIFLLCYRKWFFFNDFLKNTAKILSSKSFAIKSLETSLRDCNARAFKKHQHLCIIHVSICNVDAYSTQFWLP